MTEKKTVAVMFGGMSGEHEVSLMSARSVLEALDRDKYAVLAIGITHQGHWMIGEDVLGQFVEGNIEGLQSVLLYPEPTEGGLFMAHEHGQIEYLMDIDVAFPVLHGTFGEDGTMQGFFEVAGIAYVGAGVLASSVAMDKGLFKDLMKARGIPILDYLVFSSVSIEDDVDELIARAEEVGPYPLFTKPANLGSSVGVTRCANRSDLLEGMMEAFQYDRRIIVERGIEAREIEVSVLGNDELEASIPGEIRPSDDFYSYRAKYIDDASELIIPAPIDKTTTQRVQEIAKEAFSAIDGAGMARVDFLLDQESEELYLNEINTIPGFTKISMYPKLWEASGLHYPALMDRLIDLALDRFEEKRRLVRVYGENG